LQERTFAIVAVSSQTYPEGKELMSTSDADDMNVDGAATDPLDQTLFVVDEEQYNAFLKLLADPGEPSPALRALLRRPAPWELQHEPESGTQT
jgi:hypothetical protein